MEENIDDEEEIFSEVEVMAVDIDEETELDVETANNSSGDETRKLPLILTKKYFNSVKFKDVAKRNFSASCSKCKNSCSGSLQSTTNLKRHLRVSIF